MESFFEGESIFFKKILQSLESLGKDIAKVQRVCFDSYGDVIGENYVKPSFVNFEDRLRYITELRLKRAGVKLPVVLNERELEEVETYLSKNLEEISTISKGVSEKPLFVLADLHPMNFLVDEQGKPSGYFDLEFCQSGIPLLEIYSLKFFIFNYFDTPTFQKAEEAFFKGFESENGYFEISSLNLKRESILLVGHLLSNVVAYEGSEGFRSTWAQQFKDIMFDLIRDNRFDYVSVADVFRSKTQ